MKTFCKICDTPIASNFIFCYPCNLVKQECKRNSNKINKEYNKKQQEIKRNKKLKEAHDYGFDLISSSDEEEEEQPEQYKKYMRFWDCNFDTPETEEEGLKNYKHMITRGLIRDGELTFFNWSWKIRDANNRNTGGNSYSDRHKDFLSKYELLDFKVFKEFMKSLYTINKDNMYKNSLRFVITDIQITKVYASVFLNNNNKRHQLDFYKENPYRKPKNYDSDF